MVWNSVVDIGAPQPGIVQNIGLRVYHIECEPETGCPLHNHDTHEVFIIVSGEWKLAWLGADGERSTVLKPNDVMSVPPGILRKYRNVLPAPGKAAGMMIVIQEGMDGATEEVFPELQQVPFNIEDQPATAPGERG